MSDIGNDEESRVAILQRDGGAVQASQQQGSCTLRTVAASAVGLAVVFALAYKLQGTMAPPDSQNSHYGLAAIQIKAEGVNSTEVKSVEDSPAGEEARDVWEAHKCEVVDRATYDLARYSEFCGADNSNNAGAQLGPTLHAGSACECRRLCQTTDDCMAYTFSTGAFVDVGDNVDPPNCWLRSEMGEAVDNCEGGCYSGPV